MRWGGTRKVVLKREKILLFRMNGYKVEGCASTLLKYSPCSNKTGHLSVKELRRMLLQCSLSLSIHFHPT